MVDKKCKRAAHVFKPTADPRYLKCLWCDAIEIKYETGDKPKTPPKKDSQ